MSIRRILGTASVYPCVQDQIPYRLAAARRTMSEMVHDDSGLMILDRAQCLDRLRGAHLGSVALSVNALPVVLPVVVALLEQELVLRVRPGGVLARSMRGQVVSVLVCGDLGTSFDAGWSITATGMADPVVDPEELRRCRRLPLPAWTDSDLFLRLTITMVSGREFAERAAR